MNKKDFLEKVEKFLKDFHMYPTTFGILAKKEPLFVFMLREGRECREETQKKVLDFMKKYEEGQNA